MKNDLNDLVDEKKLRAFENEIDDLARKRFGTDDEGKINKVQILAVDRTRYESFHFQPVLYDSFVRPDTDEEQRESTLFLNLKLAADEIDLWYRLRREDARKKRSR